MTNEAFYTVVGGIGFTLHGLWWVVVQGRPEWSRSRSRRLLAYVVGLHLLIPAMTSLLSIIAPDQAYVWRFAFVVAGVAGIAGVLLVLRAIREDMDAPMLARTVQWIVLPVYALITILALAPDLPGRLGIGLTGLQVEAIIVALLLFFGVEAAWILMVEPRREDAVVGQWSGPAGAEPGQAAPNLAAGPISAAGPASLGHPAGTIRPPIDGDD